MNNNELDFKRLFSDIINYNNIDICLGVPSSIIAEFLNRVIIDLKEYLDKKQNSEKNEMVNIADFTYDCMINLKSFNENLEYNNENN